MNLKPNLILTRPFILLCLDITNDAPYFHKYIFYLVLLFYLEKLRYGTLGTDRVLVKKKGICGVVPHIINWVIETTWRMYFY